MFFMQYWSGLYLEDTREIINVSVETMMRYVIKIVERRKKISAQD
jgi:predicted transcriptional regulator